MAKNLTADRKYVSNNYGEIGKVAEKFGLKPSEIYDIKEKLTAPGKKTLRVDLEKAIQDYIDFNK